MDRIHLPVSPEMAREFYVARADIAADADWYTCARISLLERLHDGPVQVAQIDLAHDLGISPTELAALRRKLRDEGLTFEIHKWRQPVRIALRSEHRHGRPRGAAT